jgi:hypothetical protein
VDTRRVTAALAIVFGSLVTACSAAGTAATVPAETTSTNPVTGAVTIPTDSGNVTVPAATGGTTGTAGGTTGPSEKEKQRGNTPPGMSRDGAGPAAGAIVDPSGAAAGKR